VHELKVGEEEEQLSNTKRSQISNNRGHLGINALSSMMTLFIITNKGLLLIIIIINSNNNNNNNLAIKHHDHPNQ